ncbi:LysR substrate-binding domain-containing protein [Marinospirillum perlucidum]|uniref:LysR substrate-binding domain-containing protein n=1 Tax=Marinospirillum perlucidum TaxID=1982602 RepID=UPI000DF19B5A|nr:LysR substrate-binding domain-containing protein [Marinospirillum perlucidum]
MNLEVKWLEDFVALAATRSFSQAAKRRFVTQPAFSRRIQSLERAVGATLVDRSKTPLDLTADGQLFLITARNIVEQLGEALRHLRGLDPETAQLLEFTVAHSLAFNFFPQWLDQLQKVVGEVNARMTAMNVGEATHALREGRCDFMLAYHDQLGSLQLDAVHFPSLRMGMTEMLPVCAPGAGKEPLYWLDASDKQALPLLGYTRGAFLERSLRLLLRQKPVGLHFKTVYETAMAEGLKGMALQGRGIAWIPRLSIERELQEGQLMICGDEQWILPLEIRLYRCTLVHKPLVERLWQRLEKEAAQVEVLAEDQNLA